MKVALVVMLLMPLAFATEDKRGLSDFLGGLVDMHEIKCFLQHIVDMGDSDETEAACENTCHNFVLPTANTLFHSFCSPICLSAQTLIHQLDITPDDPNAPTTANGLVCGRDTIAAAPSK